ncbi:MAG: acyltransferase, partial [Limosilactobacillus sp.]|uniref:acyltransferase n=1 Tax=Limosilactobacillus sp. TaxID=2773925 RepID=UPI0026F80D9E|nr:acyltransferase [Limosilactobacillus sp.]
WYQYLLAGAYGIGTPTVQSVIPNVQVPSIGAIWFLFAMYIGNIIYQLILKLACNKSKIATTLILLVVGSVLAAIGFEISLRVQLPWSIGAALISVIFYASGHLIKIWKMMDLTVVNTVYALLGLGLWILATIKGPFYMNVGFAAHPLYATLGAIGGSYFIMYLFKLIEQKISLRLLARLGQLALITLSIHIIGLQIFTDASFLTRKLLAYGFSGGLIGVTILLYRICILWILTIILSKSKYIRYVFAIR